MKRNWLRFFFIAMLICAGGNLVLLAVNPSGPVVMSLISSVLLAIGFGGRLLLQGRTGAREKKVC